MKRVCGSMIVALGLVLAGCGAEMGDKPSPDHGTTDLGVPDAGGGEDGIADLGPADLGPADLGPADVGPGDVATDVPPDVDVPQPPKPFLSARKVATVDDRIGGDNAYGIVGKSYVLENSKARFLVQDSGTSVHLYIYGGNLIDADLMRKPGEAQNDQFRELFPIVGWRVSSMDKVEVINDGSDGEEAVIRVTGRDTDTGMIQILDDAAMQLDVTIATDYILRPDVPYLLLRTEVRNDAKASKLADQMVGDFLSFGGAERIFTVEGGFTGSPSLVKAIVGHGRGMAYGYTVDKGDITIPLVDASGTIAILGQNFTVPADGGKASFDRFFIVGTDVATVLDQVAAIRHETTVAVSGKVPMQVETTPGQFAWVGVPDAKVTAFPAGTGTPAQNGHAINQALVSPADGTWSMRLPAGKYDLVFSAPGRNRVLKVVDLGKGDLAGVDVNFPAPGTFGLDVQEVDADEKILGHVPAKATLYCTDGENAPEAPWAELGEGERYGACAVFMTPYGLADQFLAKPGRYKVVVTRGPEYEQYTQDDVLVEEGKTVWVETLLRRMMQTKGYLSGDFHQHTMGSLDAAPTQEEKVIENLVEGVEIAAITDHDMISSYGPAIQKLGVEDLITSIQGDEVSVNQVAHINMFLPGGGAVFNEDYTAGAMYPYAGTKLFARKTIPDVLTAMRAVPGVKEIQLNHPRSTGNGYLSYIGYDPTTRRALTSKQPLTLGFDSMEIVNAASVDQLGEVFQYITAADTGIAKMAAGQPDAVPVMMDWFSMLNQGMHTCAMANSDAHNRNDGVGYGRNLLRLGTDDPTKVTGIDVVDAILAQKNVVSNGAIIRVTVGGKEKMGHTELVQAEDKKITVHLVVSAAPWINLSTLEVYANGRPLPIKNLGGILIHDEVAPEDEEISTDLAPLKPVSADGAVRLDADLQLFPSRDTWYVFVVRGTGSLAPAGDGAPFAVTNPLYVDVNQDGFQALHQM